jgi:serine/threonine-protein kinase RsbW
MHTIGVAPDCTNDVELALSEACTNVLAHGDPAVEYEVRLQLSDERCVLRVIEVGQGLERKLWAVPEPAELPDGDAEHGRGLMLMRALMDRVGFRLLPGSGAVVSLESSWCTRATATATATADSNWTGDSAAAHAAGRRSGTAHGVAPRLPPTSLVPAAMSLPTGGVGLGDGILMGPPTCEDIGLPYRSWPRDG